MREDFLIAWIEKRLRILLQAGHTAGFYGASKITIVLRPESPGVERVEGIINSFIEKITNDAVRKEFFWHGIDLKLQKSVKAELQSTAEQQSQLKDASNVPENEFQPKIDDEVPYLV